jgi:tyrosyl-tRNA synthetase
MDLKSAVGRELADMLKPARDYFEKNPKYLEELKSIQITR